MFFLNVFPILTDIVMNTDACYEGWGVIDNIIPHEGRRNVYEEDVNTDILELLAIENCH